MVLHLENFLSQNLIKSGKFLRRNFIRGVVYSSIALAAATSVSCSPGSSGGGSGNDGSSGTSSGESSGTGGDSGDDSGGSGDDGEDNLPENHAPSVEELQGVYIEGDFWIFSEPVNYKVGDIIGYGLSEDQEILEKFPSGFLKEINYLSSSRRTIGVKDATIEDAIANALVLRRLRNRGYERSLEEINETFDLGSLDYEFQDVELFGLDAFLNGDISAGMSVALQASFGENGMEYFSLNLIGNESLNASASFISSVSGINQAFNVVSYDSPFTIPVSILPFPIVGTAGLSLIAGLRGDISPLDVGLTQNASAETEISHDGSWSSQSTFTNSSELTLPGIPDSLDLKVYVGPCFNILFYGFLGPYGCIDGYLRANASAGEWEVGGGLEAIVGVEMRMIALGDLDYSKSFPLHDEVLASGSSGGGDGGNETGNLTDSRDGKTYDTVKIGDQWWMAENLNFNSPNSLCYNNDQSNCDVYGRLYEFYEGMDSCPAGWHLPVTEEWNILASFLGGWSNEAGGKMKEMGTSHWNSPNTGATNESGFTGLPGGYIDANGLNHSKGTKALFLESTPSSPLVNYRLLQYNYETLGLGGGSYSSNFKASARCIKD